MKTVSSLTDEEIVQIVRTKDKEHYAEIIRRYQTKLLRYASYLTGDRETGADAVQEGFIKAFVNLNGFDIRKKFSSWMYRIVHNEVMNILHKHRKQVPMDERIHFESDGNIEDDVIKEEMVKETHRCLEKMPLIYKEPLSLMYLEERSYEEISDILRISIGTVGTRINRAKGMMKTLCQNIQ